MRDPIDIEWAKFHQFVGVLSGWRWTAVSRELHVSVDNEGRTHRIVRQAIDAGDGVVFVADNSVESGGEVERRHETTVAAFLAVQAARALPPIVEESDRARALLERVQIGGELGAETTKFLGKRRYADDCNKPDLSM